MLVQPYDTETTGLPNWKTPSGGDDQPHLVQLATCIADDQTGEIKQSLNVIIKPNGWEIPPETTEIHGITQEMAMDIGIPEDLAVDMFLEMWGGKHKTIAHNRTFDQRIMRICFKRYATEEVCELWQQNTEKANAVCTGLLAKPIMKMTPKNKYGYKMPKLTEAYEYFLGCEMEGAHDAWNDMMGCFDVYRAIMARK